MQKTQETNIEEIVRKYSDMVYRLAKVHTTQESDAQDVFQETFLRLVKHIHHLEDEEHIKAWLIRVTINCCKTQVGSAWRRKAVLVDKQILEAQSESMDVQFDEQQETNEVYEAVKSLPHKYRDVIHLFYFEELSVREISTLLKRKETTVKSQLSRARAMMSQMIDRHGQRKEDA